MTTEVLRDKTGRYLCGQSAIAEKKQIQNWLSSTANKQNTISEEDRKHIEDEITAQVKAYVVSSTFEVKEESWWKKITASF